MPGEYSVSLTIHKVVPELGGTRNTLTVTNEQGTTNYSFKLLLGDKPPAGDYHTVKR